VGPVTLVLEALYKYASRAVFRKEGQFMYNLTFMGVCATIVAVEKK